MNPQSIHPDTIKAVFSYRGAVLFVGLALVFMAKDPPLVQLGGLILATLAIVLVARARRRRKVRIGEYVLSAIWVAAWLSPIYSAIAKEPSAQALENREGYYRRLCPDWIEGNIWDKYIRGQEFAWCRNYEDRLAAEGLLPSRKVNSSASEAVSTTQLWK